MGLEPTNLLTASQALYQLSYAPGPGEPSISLVKAVLDGSGMVISAFWRPIATISGSTKARRPTGDSPTTPPGGVAGRVHGQFPAPFSWPWTRTRSFGGAWRSRQIFGRGTHSPDLDNGAKERFQPGASLNNLSNLGPEKSGMRRKYARSNSPDDHRWRADHAEGRLMSQVKVNGVSATVPEVRPIAWIS